MTFEPMHPGAATALTARRSRPYRVVVVGAGYAGVIAANRILSACAAGGLRPGAVHLDVINPRPDFVQRIRLHELAAGTSDAARLPLADVLHPRARVLLGAAVRIDAGARTVHVRPPGGGGDPGARADGAGRPGPALSYDSLVYAVGSRAGDGVPGSATHAHPLADLDAAERLRRRIAGLPPGAVVAVVGGGLTGVEAATEIAERNPRLRVHLVSSGPVAAGMGTRARRGVAAALRGLGVFTHEHRPVREVRDGGLRFAGGTVLGFDACAWAGPMGVPDLARDSGLGVDAVGRLLVDGTLRCPEHPEIVGAGDAVLPPAAVAGHLRMSCAAALPLGAHAADTVLAAIAAAGGDPTAVPRLLSVGFVVQCVSLGRARGIVQPVRPDDTPRPFALGGRPGAWVKERVCRYTVAALASERRRPGSLRVIRGPRPEAADRGSVPAAGEVTG